jgi:hypothetical protein
VYKARTYDTEELLIDKKKSACGQLIFDDSVKRLWAIRRYESTNMSVMTHSFVPILQRDKEHPMHN